MGFQGLVSHADERSRSRAARGLAATVQSRMAGDETATSFFNLDKNITVGWRIQKGVRSGTGCTYHCHLLTLSYRWKMSVKRLFETAEIGQVPLKRSRVQFR